MSLNSLGFLATTETHLDADTIMKRFPPPKPLSLYRHDQIRQILDDFFFIQVAANSSQVTLHHGTREINEGYISTGLYPLLKANALPHDYPGLAVPSLKSTLPIPDLPRDRKCTYKLRAEEQIVLLDGHHRLCASSRLYDDDGAWVFLVLHPGMTYISIPTCFSYIHLFLSALAAAPDVLLSLIVNRCNIQQGCLLPHPCDELKVGIQIASHAYQRGLESSLDIIFRESISKRYTKHSVKGERSIQDQIRRIAGASDLVQALEETQLISRHRPLWYGSGDGTVAFLYALQRFRLYRVSHIFVGLYARPESDL